MTDAVDFRGRRPSKDGMLVEGVDFDKILALLPLKMLIFLQFVPAKQGVHSYTLLKFFRDATAKAVSRQKEYFSGASCYVVAVNVCFFAANFAMYMMWTCTSGL